ncbi:MAG: TolC family protein [Bacillota bacterium]
MEKKTIVFSCLVIVLVFSSLIVQGAEIEELKPSAAIELARENSLELQMARLELDNAEIDYEKSKAQNAGDESRYNELQTELQIDQAEENFAGEEESLIISVVEDYMQILSDTEDIEITEKQKDLQKKQLEETKAQHEAGHVGNRELTETEHSYENIQNDLKYAQQELEHLKSKFKNRLGIDQETEIELIEIERPEVMERTKEEVISMIVENNFGLEVDRRQVQLAEVELERAEVSSVSSLDKKKLENDLKLAELNLEKNKQNIKDSAQSQYNSFLRAADSMDMAEKSLAQERENFALAEDRYEAEIVTENQLLSSEIDLLEAENSYNEAIVNYLISELNLMQSMGLDLGRVYDEQLKEE